MRLVPHLPTPASAAPQPQVSLQGGLGGQSGWGRWEGLEPTAGLGWSGRHPSLPAGSEVGALGGPGAAAGLWPEWPPPCPPSGERGGGAGRAWIPQLAFGRSGRHPALPAGRVVLRGCPAGCLQASLTAGHLLKGSAWGRGRLVSCNWLQRPPCVCCLELGVGAVILRGQRGATGGARRMCRGLRPLQHPPLSSLLLVLTCPARPGQPLALSSTAGVRGPGNLWSHAAGPEKARIWHRLRRLRTEHFGPPRPGSDSVSTHWVGTLLQLRGSDLVSPLRWPLDTCVLCPPIPLPAPGWGRHRDSLRWEAVLPARALRPWAGPCARSAFLGGQICTGAFLHCLPMTQTRAHGPHPAGVRDACRD